MKELNKERKNIDKKSFNALYVLRDLLSFEQFKKCEKRPWERLTCFKGSIFILWGESF